MIASLSPLSPSILLTAALCLPTCLSWTFSSTNINLSYPPPLNSGYAAENDKAVGPDVIFPCADVPVDPSEIRVQFPSWGAALTYSLTNNTVGSLKDYQYILDIYLGQISLGGGTYSPSNSSMPGSSSGYAYVDTEVYEDFATGLQCSYEFDAVDIINKALGTEYTRADVVGMNATFGVRLVLFGPNPLVKDMVVDDYNQEEMYQCGYVTFTNPDPSTLDGSSNFCLSSNSLSPSPSSSSVTAQVSLSSGTITNIPPTAFTTLYTSAVTTTAFAYPTPASSAAGVITETLGAGSASQPTTHTVAVGTGVGVSMGASLLILAIGFVLLRRRRARRARSGTIGAHILVCPAPNDQELKDMTKAKGRVEEKGVESSGNSVHSEPLPLYTETMKGTK